MQEHSAPLIGRDDEVEAVAEVLRSTGAGARSVLVTGEAGAGKTAVVEQARRVAVRQGAKVLRLGWADAEGPDGAEALADAVCGVLARIHDGRLPARITAVRRVRLRTADRGGEAVLLSTLGEVLADAAHYLSFALILDDAERMPARTASALGLLLRAFRPAEVPVVMAGRPMVPGRADGTRLPASADRVLELPPLPSADVGELIVRRLGRPVEPALVTVVLRSLGPLAGNPAAVLSVLASLEERGRLLELDGQVCLTELGGQVRLTTDALELGRLGRPGASPDADTVGTAAALARLVEGAELRLEDLHCLKSQVAHSEAVGRTVDRLVRDRVLAVDWDGRIAFAVPALAAALRTLPARSDLRMLPDDPDMRSLHARIVTSVTDRLGADAAGAGHPRLADHVAAAGPKLDDALAVPLLLAAARRGRTNSAWAVRGYVAALRRLPPDDSRTPGVLRESAGVSLRYADHAGVLALGEPLFSCLDGPLGGTEDRDGLEWVARAWTLSALYEHRSPHAEDADPRFRAALERVCAAAELAALGGRYGIGPTAPGPWPAVDRATVTDRDPAPDCDAATGQAAGSGPVPSPAEVRLLAAAAGSSAEFERARRGLPRDAFGEEALDRLRNAAAFGDLAGAFEAVLGERYIGAGDSTALRYHTMVRDYLTGDWDRALSTARRIEARGRADGAGGVGHLARALAAEIQLQRGEVGHAREWLDLIPDSVTHSLVARVRLLIRYFSEPWEEAVAGAWRDLREARESGQLAGVEWLPLRVLWIGIVEDSPEVRRQALAELEALHEEMASPMTHESVLLGRGMAYHDADSALAAYRLVQERGDVYYRSHCCQVLAEAGEDPQPWLAEATRILHSLGVGRPIGIMLRSAARRRNVSLPRHRATREELTEQDVRLIDMVSAGSTNRQIAAGLACSEKTVEQRLTRVFRRTGCRSRTELAAAWLDGSLARSGLVPDAGQHGGDGGRPAARPAVV
ncbi:helix-turn-helix transcriptional regulator [Streptomyces mirabilis]